MQQKTNESYLFGDFRLDVSERRLLRHGELVPLPPKVFDLLAMLVENPGRLLEKDYLLKSIWPDTFVEEANLSVNVSALRRLLGDEAGQPRWIETVPKRGYRFLPEVRRAGEETAQARRRRLPFGRVWLGVTLLLAVVAVVLMTRRWVGRPSPATLRSIAVLPFTPLSDDASQHYLGLGMADALTTRLMPLGKIEVTPTSSIRRFTGVNVDPLAAGRELHVDALVEGRIQHQDKRVRVTVQLLRVRDGRQLWARTFDDYFSNIFAVQDSIAEQVAEALSLPLSAADQRALARRSTENTEAYRYYLQGQYLVSKRLNEATQNAIDSFERAAELDPDYPLPHAALASSYLFRAGEGFGEGFREKAKTAALKALSLDDKLPEAHLALGQVLMRSEWDWTGAEREFRRALSLNRNLAQAHAALSTLHTALGRHEEALADAAAACRLEPASSVFVADRSWSLVMARRFDEALAQAHRAVELDPWSYSAHRQLGKALQFKSMAAEAISEATKCRQITAGHPRRILAELAKAYVAAGRMAEARTALAQLEDAAADGPAPVYEMAVLYAALGDRDSAFRSLEEAFRKRNTRVIWMKSDPELDPLRPDPRFAALLAQLRLPQS